MRGSNAGSYCFPSLVLALTLSAPSFVQAQGAVNGLTHARAMVESHRTVPSFAGLKPFDARTCAGGKRMLSIPNTSANPFLKGIIEREIAVGHGVGLLVREWQNEGHPTEWIQGMDYARNNGFNIVDLISGIDPRTLEPQIRAAAAAGVKTMVSHFYDPSQAVDPVIAYSLPVKFNLVGRLLADWVTIRTSAKAVVVLVVSNEVPPTAPLVDGFKDELQHYCKQCRIVQEINTGFTEWSVKIRPSVQSVVIANSDVNFVIPIYDSMTQFVVPALQATGTQSRVKVASFNGTPFVLDYVREGKVDMDIGESLDWIARATVDAYLRELCNLSAPRDIGVPFLIFDASNVKSAGIPARFDQGYGTDYIRGFERAWMLK